MNTLSGLACAATLSCISCGGQTNVCASRSVPFILPPVQLRLERGADSDKSEPIASGKPTSSASVARMAPENGLIDFDLHSRVLRSGEFYLTRTEPRSDNVVAKFVDGVFRPEDVQVGKVSMACPFVTAIKRNNPLSLLSGISTRPTLTGDGQICFKLLELSW